MGIDDQKVSTAGMVRCDHTVDWSRAALPPDPVDLPGEDVAMITCEKCGVTGPAFFEPLELLWDSTPRHLRRSSPRPR
jgi:hypothetical protein